MWHFHEDRAGNATGSWRQRRARGNGPVRQSPGPPGGTREGGGRPGTRASWKTVSRRPAGAAGLRRPLRRDARGSCGRRPGTRARARRGGGRAEGRPRRPQRLTRRARHRAGRWRRARAAAQTSRHFLSAAPGLRARAWCGGTSLLGAGQDDQLGGLPLRATAVQAPSDSAAGALDSVGPGMGAGGSAPLGRCAGLDAVPRGGEGSQVLARGSSCERWWGQAWPPAAAWGAGRGVRWARAAHKPRPFLAPPPLPSTWAKPSSRPGTRATLWWHRCHSRPGPQAWERAWLRTDLRRERLAGPLPAPRAVLPWKGVGTTRLKSQVRGAVGATLIAALKPLGGAAAQPPQNSSGSSTINYF